MISHKLRSTIALALLRCLFPKGMSGARAAIVQLIPEAELQAIEEFSLLHLLETRQVLLAPSHPNLRALDLARPLGAKVLQIPKGNLRKVGSSQDDARTISPCYFDSNPIFGDGFKPCAAQDSQRPGASSSEQTTEEDHSPHPEHQQSDAGGQ